MKKEVLPLPEVTSEGTVHLDVGSLGLPVGLDLSRIGFHQTNTEKAAHLIGTELLHIRGYAGDDNQTHISGNVHHQGTISGARARTEKAERGNTAAYTPDPDLFSPVSGIGLNKTHRKAAMGETANLYDPAIQAASLNWATKIQLLRLAKESNIGGHPYTIELDIIKGLTAALFVAERLGHLETYDYPGYVSGLSPLMYSIAGATILGETYSRHKRAALEGREARHSAFSKVRLDRLAASAGFILSHNFFSTLEPA